MTFILAAERSGSPSSVGKAFDDYRAYLQQHEDRFPPGAYALATSEWYYDCENHRGPHDAWLEQCLVQEDRGEESGVRSVTLELKLLGPYHDGHIVLRYPEVVSYDLAVDTGMGGHRDWRYDEFRISDAGHLIHEIEWAGPKKTGRWLIEAIDVEYSWEPIEC